MTVTRWLLRTARRFQCEEQGAALLEFAIVSVLLVTLVVGMMDMGRFIFLRNNLISAARDGARLGAVTEIKSADITNIRTAVRALIVDDSASQANVQVDTITSNGTKLVRVRVLSYPFKRVSLLPFIKQRIDTVQAVFRWEFQ